VLFAKTTAFYCGQLIFAFMTRTSRRVPTLSNGSCEPVWVFSQTGRPGFPPQNCSQEDLRKKKSQTILRSRR
jgi:hypothetical protein